jgi:hypothetical protein
MKRPDHKVLAGRLAAAAALAAALGLASAACKTPNDPNLLVSDVLAVNSCGAAVDVFMDGTKQFSLDDGYHLTIQGVSRGSHQFTAKKKGTEMLVASATIAISGVMLYEFDIVGPSAIVVANRAGENVRISLDGADRVELSDGTDATLSAITFGVHDLVAKSGAGAVLDSISINVQEVRQYDWTVTK